MADPVYKKVTDGQGNVSFVEVSQGSLPIDAVSVAGEWLKARAGESSTKIGAIGGVVAAPTIADYAGKAVIAGLAGDYVSCAMYGVPALVGIVGSLAAIVTPEKPKGPTDEEIHSAVARMPRDQLISLLNQPIATAASGPVPTAGGSI